MKTAHQVQLAAVLLAEIGPDMHRFPTAGHLVSWAGLCPGLNETGGRNRSSHLRKGAPWLKAVLLQAAWSAVRTKDCYFRALYYRIKGRRGPQKAIVAVAAAMLRAFYIMMRDHVVYRDLGPEHFPASTKTSSSADTCTASGNSASRSRSNKPHEPNLEFLIRLASVERGALGARRRVFP